MDHDKDALPPPASARDDVFLARCHAVIRMAVRFLAVLMTFVICWGTLDVVWVMYRRMAGNPYFLLDISDILATFGAFLAVLIAIEIFENIVMYLRMEFIQVRLVLATALMAAARKVIVLDFQETDPQFVWAIAAVILSLGVVYWLLSAKKTAAPAPGNPAGTP